MINKAYLALGTNQGDRRSFLQSAIKLMDEHSRISIIDYSSIYETEPIGYTNQPKFLNMVLYLTTSLSAYELLDVTQGIENNLGRKRDVRWGPRTIDLDILLYNDENIKSERLVVPHPRMFERAFVMIPLLEIAEDFIHRYYTQVQDLQDKEGVTVFQQKEQVAFTVVEKTL